MRRLSRWLQRELTVIVAAGTVLLAGIRAYGQPTPLAPAGGGADKSDVTCPLDGNRFKASLGDAGDRYPGMDSDQCRHDLGSQPLPYLVVVCPRCNYAAPRMLFQQEIPEAKKPGLLRALVKSKYRGVADTIGEIPAWDRFRLAGECSALVDRPEDRLESLRLAVYAVRVDACRSATRAWSQPYEPVRALAEPINQWMSTRGVDDVVREIAEKVAAAKTPEEKNRLSLQMAMMLERGGFAAKRDAALASLAAAAPDPAIAGSLARFRSLLAIEREEQGQLVDALRERLKKPDLKPEERVFTTYMVADTLRRLGKDAEAVVEFRAARRMMPQPTLERVLTDHFLTMLAPGEPLPAPEPPPAPVPAATGEKAPETPVVAPEPPKTEGK